jgi:hypothetical protein
MNNKMTGIVTIMSVLSIGVLNSCLSNNGVQNGNSNTYETITSTSIDIYYENEKSILQVSFINAVNRWLRRYSPQMITRGDDYVKMQVKYDYLYDIELFVREDDYEIVVTFVQAGKQPPYDAQKDAVHLSTGILKVMEDYIANRSSARNHLVRKE